MATINIAFGGQNIGVEIPDIALDSTMRDVLAEASAQKQLLSNIAQKIGADTKQTQSVQRETSQDIVRAVNEQGDRQASRLERVVGYSAQSIGKIEKGLMGISGNEKMSDLTSGMADAMGLGMIGAQVGTLFGIMEEFGHSMNNLRRVGTGYVDNLKQLSLSTAQIGLGLEGFAAIVGENGKTIRALGDNTTDGSNALIRLVKNFRLASEGAGYFGMSSQEMARLLVDEAELRRRISGSDKISADAQDKMVASVQEQLKLNEAMAKLTGQDIRDRIKASQQFKADAVNSALMSTLTEDQIKAVDAANAGLSQLGPSISGAMQEALSLALSGLPAMSSEAFAQLTVAADSVGKDVRGQFDHILSMIQQGVDPKDIKSAADAMAADIKDIDATSIQMLAQQAKVGFEGANLLLTARMEAVSSGAGSVAESTAKIATSLNELNELIATDKLGLSAVTADMEQGAQTFRKQLMDSILKAFEAGDLGEGSAQFTQFVKSMRDLPSAERFKAFSDTMSELVSVTSGAQGLVKLLQGQGAEADLGESVYLGAAFLQAIGQSEAAQAMRIAGLPTIADDAAAGIGNIVVPGMGDETVSRVNEMLNRVVDEGTDTLKVTVDNTAELFKGLKDEILNALNINNNSSNSSTPTIPDPDANDPRNTNV